MSEMNEHSTVGPSSGQWKSRFPVARIKKIMQADEDVGKVAQVTPVAICMSPLPPVTSPVYGVVRNLVAVGADFGCSEGVGVVYGSDY